MITIPLWEMVVFVLSGVALGAVIVIVSSSRRAVPTNTEPESSKTVGTTPLIVQRESLPQPKPKSGTLSPEERMERITTFLKKRIASKRSVTIDEAAKCLSTSPRRVHRLLESGVLIPIPLPGGGRRVSSVSVFDLLVRKGIPVDRLGVPAKRTGEAEQQEPKKLVPKARQMYWYYVEGCDEPFRTVHEAVRACGLDIVCTGWGDIPKSIRSKIRRERTRQQEGANGQEKSETE